MAELEVRELLDRYFFALDNKNSDGARECWAPHLTQFGLAPPLVENGTDEAQRQDLEAWFERFDGELDFETRDLHVFASRDVAYCHLLTHLMAQRTDGTLVDLWYRQTFGLQKLDGRWLIEHSHASVPFEMDGSSKAATELHP